MRDSQRKTERYIQSGIQTSEITLLVAFGEANVPEVANGAHQENDGDEQDTIADVGGIEANG